MSTTGRPADAAGGAESAAAAIRESGFVRVVSHADGIGLAAVGVLARALDDESIPFQVSVARTDAVAAGTLAGADESSATVAFGFDDTAIAGRDSTVEPSAAFDGPTAVREAAAVARELGATPFEPLVLAGLRSAGEVPTEDDGDVERRPGVGIPVDDLGDGLAHSTLLHGGFSGDESRAGATLAELGLPADLDAKAHRRLASIIALEATEGPAPERAADALQQALHPHVHGECAFATIEGFGDVLDSLARHAPGLGVATAIGRLDRTVALDAWREYGETVQQAIAHADVPAEGEDHVVSVSVSEADPVAVARLLRDFVAVAPNVLVTADDGSGAALATVDVDARETFASADADAVGGSETLAYATVDTDEDADDTDEESDAESTSDALDALEARVRGVL